MVNNALSTVVPAKAGTHTPQRSCYGTANENNSVWWFMGPRFRGDDRGEHRSPDRASAKSGKAAPAFR